MILETSIPTSFIGGIHLSAVLGRDIGPMVTLCSSLLLAIALGATVVPKQRAA
ncbi:MAG: hypothetical protein WD826_00565 [Actinomycetota bacterium]